MSAYAGPWVHNISPFLWEFSNSFGIRWYGLAYLCGFFLTYYIIDQMAKRGAALISRDQAADFVTYGAIGTLVGGRIGYALFYSPDLLITFHGDFPFWGLLEVHKGGMASHGGIAGIIVASLIFARKHKVLATHLIDLTCLGGGLGIFFGRIANFINGELYGRECSPDLWMAVKFPSEIYSWGGAESEKIRALGPAVQALGEVRTWTGEKLVVTTELWSSWVNGVGANVQTHISFFKETLVKATENHNEAVIAALAPALTPRYPSQLIQAFLEGLLVFLILFWLWRRPQKPGFISAMFGVLYCIARIIGEQFRLPDQGIGFQALGLTRGQWLSVTMLAMTLVYLYFVLRRRTERIGGWETSHYSDGKAK